jgi:hypothetical protein
MDRYRLTLISLLFLFLANVSCAHQNHPTLQRDRAKRTDTISKSKITTTGETIGQEDIEHLPKK